MATITKDGYTYNTETKTRTSPTGKVVSIENMDAITPNLKADTPISLDSLNQTNQLSLPEAKPEVSPTYTLTPLETFERDTQMRAEASDKNYLDTQRAIGEAEARELDYQEELGASANLKAFKNYERQLQAEQLALRRYKEDISGETSMSEAMTNAAINQEEARSLRKQADIAILGNMALGNYNEAIQTAKTKVEMELKPLTRQLDYYKTVMERNQDLLSTAQKSKLQSLYSDIERQKNKEEERLTKGNEMIINALSFNAPASSIEKAKSILEKGGTITEMATALGKYSGDYYKTELLRQQIETEKAQRNQIYANTEKIKNEGSKTEEKPATASQFTASGYASRVVQSKDIIDSNLKNILKMSPVEYAIQRKLPNMLQSPIIQQQLQAERNFINAVLRRESGAAIAESEFESAEKQYFPVPGDSQEVLAQKKANRDLVSSNLINESGSAYVKEQENKFSTALNKSTEKIQGTSIVQSILPNGEIKFIIPNQNKK